MNPAVIFPVPAPDKVEELSAGRPEVDVTVVVPMRNEGTTISAVCAELQAVMDAERLRYEAIVVNDGSSDETARELEKVACDDPRFTIVEFARGFGQAAALAAGFRMARGSVVVAMDGGGQNDPRDIPRLVARLSELPACDLVSGWRQERKDEWLSRRFPSMCANFLIRRLTSCRKIHDFGRSRPTVRTSFETFGSMARCTGSCRQSVNGAVRAWRKWSSITARG